LSPAWCEAAMAAFAKSWRPVVQQQQQVQPKDDDDK
jgi:hypothetical protein